MGISIMHAFAASAAAPRSTAPLLQVPVFPFNSVFAVTLLPFSYSVYHACGPGTSHGLARAGGSTQGTVPSSERRPLGQ